MKHATIAITGSRGFIGGEVLRQWQSSTDAQSQTIVPWEGDILDDAARELFFSTYHPTCIVHLAGKTRGSFAEVHTHNVLAVHTLFSSAVKHDCSHIVFASTAAVYGNTGDTPVTEQQHLQPVNDYGLSKMLAEEIISFFLRTHNITCTILRLSNVYGNEAKKGVVFDMLSSLQRDGTIMIDGDGSQLRNFTHVADVARVIRTAATKDTSGIFNIGGESCSIIALATMLQKKHGGNLLFSQKASELHKVLLDSSLATAYLSFQPTHSLAEL